MTARSMARESLRGPWRTPIGSGNSRCAVGAGEEVMMRRNWKARLVSSLIFAMATGGSVGPVGAQVGQSAPAEAAEVERLLIEAVKLRRARKDDEALRLVERARVKSASPRVRAHLAAAHQAVGHWLQAERLWRDLLEMSDDAYIVSRVATLRRAHEFVQRYLRRMDVVAHPELLRSGERLGAATACVPGPMAGCSRTHPTASKAVAARPHVFGRE